MNVCMQRCRCVYMYRCLYVCMCMHDMCLYVHMYMCTKVHTCMSTCIHVYIYICTDEYMYMYICLYVSMYVCIYIYARMYACMLACMYVCSFGYTCMYVCINIHEHMHVRVLRKRHKYMSVFIYCGYTWAHHESLRDVGRIPGRTCRIPWSVWVLHVVAGEMCRARRAHRASAVGISGDLDIYRQNLRFFSYPCLLSSPIKVA